MAASDESVLQGLTRKYAEENVPVIIYLTIVLIFGILGNTVAIAFYGFHVKRTVTTFLLTTLSVNDLVTTVIMLVLSLVLFSSTLAYHSATGCKLRHFLGHVFSGNSLLLLLLIGVDRYLRIRWTHLKIILSKRSAVIAVVALFIFSVLYAFRVLFFIDGANTTRERFDSYNETITGLSCEYSPDYEIGIKFFHVTDMVIIILNILGLTVLYILIGKWILSSKRKLSLHKVNTQGVVAASSEESPNAVEIELTNDLHEESTDNYEPNQNISEDKTSSAEHNSKTGNHKMRPSKSKMLNSSAVVNVERKLTMMAFVITVASILSFVPYFILVILLEESHQYHPRDSVTRALIQIGLRSVLLNSTVNPYIMGVFNREFRKFVIRLFSKSCYMSRRN